MKNGFLLILAGIIGGFISLLAYRALGLDGRATGMNSAFTNPFVRNVSYSSERVDSLNNAFNVGFGEAAERSLQEVVHIRAITNVAANRRQYQSLEDFFGSEDPFGESPRQQDLRQQSSGSGVIIRQDGYIITNNHVVSGASDLEVSLHDNRTYKAKIIGTDPSTDLALIKIDERNLPFSTFANSDQVRVGDWVLAVGNPFDLASTVTAGIVSATARNIHILEGNSAIESFIQTDAAVNPGNSGGALVNLKGQLVGINTAIATPTGTYAGYAFAVPSNIAARVVGDLIKHGSVQRAYLGVTIADLNSTIAKQLNLNRSEGVLINEVLEAGAAGKAGIQSGDVIVGIGNRPIRSSAELLETIAGRHPGEQVSISFIRKGQEKQVQVKLTGESGVIRR